MVSDKEVARETACHIYPPNIMNRIIINHLLFI